MIGRPNIILRRNGQIELHFISPWDLAMLLHMTGAQKAGHVTDTARRQICEAAKGWKPDQILTEDEVAAIKAARQCGSKKDPGYHELVGDQTVDIEYLEPLTAQGCGA